MNDPMDALKGILGNDAEDKIKNVMSQLTDNSSENEDANEYLNDMKLLVDKLSNSKADPRANLLLSLRPYMSSGRRKSIDSAVKLLNLSKLSGFIKL